MILIEPRGDIAVITLDRPERRNALTPKMLASLVGGVDRAASARAILLLGAGETFCAGFDLDLCRASPTGAAMRELLTGLSLAIRALRSAPCPVLAAVQGAAIAGGCGLLGGADVVLAEPDAKFGYPVLRLGVSPAVSAPFLHAAVGAGPARARLLDTHLLSGREALAIGLVHELIQGRDELTNRALSLAASLAAKPSRAVAMTKRWLDEIAGPDPLAAHLGLEVSANLTGSAEEQTRLVELWTFESRNGLS